MTHFIFSSFLLHKTEIYFVSAFFKRVSRNIWRSIKYFSDEFSSSLPMTPHISLTRSKFMHNSEHWIKSAIPSPLKVRNGIAFRAHPLFPAILRRRMRYRTYEINFLVPLVSRSKKCPPIDTSRTRQAWRACARQRGRTHRALNLPQYVGARWWVLKWPASGMAHAYSHLHFSSILR